MDWKVHIQTLVMRARKLIYVFKWLRAAASLDTMKMVYYALMSCVSWGGTLLTHMLRLERAQRAILKVMLSKPYRYPTTRLYVDSSVLSTRKLFIMQVILRKHAETPYDPALNANKRRKHQVCTIDRHRTALAARHYGILSSRLYNVANQTLQIYHLSSGNCKKVLIDWLKTLSYYETEGLFKIVK